MNAVITAKRTVTTGAFASGTILYSWKQQVPALLAGGYEDPLSFRQGTVTSDTVWESPAVEINNASVDVGTNVWLRQRGYVLGVMTYEFNYTPPAASIGYRANPSTFSYSSLIHSSQVITVPRGNYLILAQLALNFSGGAGSAYFSVNVSNNGVTSSTRTLVAAPMRIDGVSGAFVAGTLNQIIVAGELDDDGSTPTVDIRVYSGTYSGVGPTWAANSLTAIPLASVVNA
jgi:hypothetical protein